MMRRFVVASVFCGLALASAGGAGTGASHPDRERLACATKLIRLFPEVPTDHSLDVLNDRLILVLEKDGETLHVFSPYFAGSTKYKFGRDGKTTEEPLPRGLNYDNHVVRIPFASGDGSPSGFYYVDITASLKVKDRVFNLIYRDAGGPLFIPGDPRPIPSRAYAEYLRGLDLNSKEREKRQKAIPMVQYHSLDIEDRIWDKQNPSYSTASVQLLEEIMASAEKSIAGEFGHYPAVPTIPADLRKTGKGTRVGLAQDEHARAIVSAEAVLDACRSCVQKSSSSVLMDGWREWGKALDTHAAQRKAHLPNK